jgi:23S rRNA (uracil-5-)-methyltransferase RumA
MEESKPLCPYFGVCGGCTTQHIPYSLQLRNKRQFVIDAMKRNSIPLAGDVETFHAEPYGYRNRMDFICFSKGFGFRQAGKFDKFIDVRKCVISNSKVNSLLEQLWSWFDKNRDRIDPFEMRLKTGTLKAAVIRASVLEDSSSVSFVLSSDSSKQADHIELVRDFAKTTDADTVVIAQVGKHEENSISEEFFTVKGDGMLKERIAGSDLSFHSQGFFQNNQVMADKMVLYVKSLLEKQDTKNYSLVDLYGGVGTFGAAIAPLFSNTILIESVKAGTDCAEQNAKTNKLKNFMVVCGDARKIKQPAVQKFLKEDVVVVTDPPRSGMDQETLRSLMALAPKTIIYVSCNPAQLAKELRTMTRKYELKSLAVFDLFPQTNHVEAVAELMLRK